jgi:hypothetical protein
LFRAFCIVQYATTQIPTYPAGQIGLLLCSKQVSGRKVPSCVNPVRKVALKDAEKYSYYTTELHSASFTLPAFVARRVEAAKAAAKEEKDASKEAAAASGSAKKAAGKKRASVGVVAEDEEKDAKAAKQEEAAPAAAAAAAPAAAE